MAYHFLESMISTCLFRIYEMSLVQVILVRTEEEVSAVSTLDRSTAVREKGVAYVYQRKRLVLRGFRGLR